MPRALNFYSPFSQLSQFDSDVDQYSFSKASRRRRMTLDVGIKNYENWIRIVFSRGVVVTITNNSGPLSRAHFADWTYIDSALTVGHNSRLFYIYTFARSWPRSNDAKKARYHPPYRAYSHSFQIHWQ